MILFAIDGPKAAGKSTIIKQLIPELKQLKIDNINSLHFDSSTYLNLDTYSDLVSSNNNTLVDRGLLSYIIYGFLESYKPEVEAVTYDFGSVTTRLWRQMTLDDCVNYNKSIKGYHVVLYSSDDAFLLNRLINRDLETARVTTEIEKKFLLDSNAMFKLYGSIMQQYSDNVILIDICKGIDTHHIIEQFKKKLAF